MNELALYAGVGGGLLATKWLLEWDTVCYVEWDEYCIKVLRQRIADGLLDDAPIWDDARTFDGIPWCGCVDIITAGFPCTPFSVAGKQQAEADERNMWPDTIRIIREVRSPFVLLENVPGLLAGSHGYFGQILGELAESGYDARWCCFNSRWLGLRQDRNRLFVVGCREMLPDNCGWQPQEPSRWRLPQWGKDTNGTPSDAVLESMAARDDAGIANRMDRSRAAGNVIIPAVVSTVWRLLMGDSPPTPAEEWESAPDPYASRPSQPVPVPTEGGE